MIRQKVTGYDDILTFGKHKGQTVRLVAECDPGYIVWLNSEEIVDFPEDIVEAAMADDADQSPPEDWVWTPDD